MTPEAKRTEPRPLAGIGHDAGMTLIEALSVEPDVNTERAHLLAQLRGAESRIIDAEDRLRDQQRIVDELERDGHDATKARAVLRTFTMSRAASITVRDLVIETLEALDKQNPVRDSP